MPSTYRSLHDNYVSSKGVGLQQAFTKLFMYVCFDGKAFLLFFFCLFVFLFPLLSEVNQLCDVSRDFGLSDGSGDCARHHCAGETSTTKNSQGTS